MFTDFVIPVKLVCAILVLIHAVLGDLKEFKMVLPVRVDLPLHEGISSPVVMVADQAHLQPLHLVVMMTAGVPPDQQGSLHNIAVSKVAISE